MPAIASTRSSQGEQNIVGLETIGLDQRAGKLFITTKLWCIIELNTI